MNIKNIKDYCKKFELSYKKYTRENYTEDELELYMSNEIRNNSFVDFDIEQMRLRGKIPLLVFDFDKQQQCISDSVKEKMVEEFTGLIHQASVKYLDDFDTLSGIFVCCCNFMVIHAINKLIFNYNDLIDQFCSKIVANEDREFLRLMGNGIFLREENSEASIRFINKAINLYPKNEVSMIYNFIIISHYYEYFTILDNKNESAKYKQLLTDAYSKLSVDIKNIVMSKNHSDVLLPSFIPKKTCKQDNTMIDFLKSDEELFDSLLTRKWLVFINETLYIDNTSFRDYLDLLAKLRNIWKMLSEIKCKSTISEIDPLSDDFESEVSKLINDLSQKINDELSDSDLVETEEQLKMFFGEIVWNGFAQYTKTSLKSAAFLMNACKRLADSADMDYSGICISATSALECEIKRVFFDEFKKYCETLPNNPVPFPLAKEFRNESMFTLGSLRYALCDYPRDKWNRLGHAQQEKVNDSRELMGNYLMIHFFPNKRCQHPISKFRFGNNVSFLDLCEAIRNNYRNPAAHSEKMSAAQAENCYINVVGKASGEQHIENVKGALKLLYEIIDITSFTE